MLSNIILLVILLTILLFIWLIWLRQSLLHQVRQIEHLEEILKKDCEIRRDKVPYLLESLRAISQQGDAWHSLVSSRAKVNTVDDFETENEFEKTLMEFLDRTNFKDVNVLEAKKEIMDSTEIIRQVRSEILLKADAFNALKKEFPYSVASNIFGFKEIGVI